MKSIKFIVAAGIIAASTAAVSAQEGNSARYPMMQGYDSVLEGRNVEIAPRASTEVGVDKFDRRMPNRPANMDTDAYEGRLTNESARQRGTSRYAR